MDVIQNRYDFVLLMDVKDGNPNGDPDAGNLPRIDPETGHGLITDVCLKRKVRNLAQIMKEGEPGYDIYVKEKAILGRAHVGAFKNIGIKLGEETRKQVPTDLASAIGEVTLPEGLSVENDGDNTFLVMEASAEKEELKKWAKELKKDKEIADAKKIAEFVEGVVKEGKSRKPTGDETEKGRAEMCRLYYDIRTFGGVLSLKVANCGQVRGPVQLTFARSVDPIVQSEHSITRMAVATEAEAEKQSGDNRTMGRKFTIPYALYRAHGFVSAPLAAQTGFTESDLEFFFNALSEMFEHDRSAARGLMSTRALIVFQHNSKYGNAKAHTLFDRVVVRRREGVSVPRSFGDYEVTVDSKDLPAGVNISVK